MGLSTEGGADTGTEAEPAGVVTQLVTNGDRSALFVELPEKPVFAPGGNAFPTIKIDTGTSFQTMDGFGFTLTEGAAEVIGALPDSVQGDLLEDVFHPERGIGVSVVRISIGASDLSSSSYSYQEFRSYAGSTAPIGSFVTLRGAVNGKYVSSEDGESPMHCNRATASSWETFRVVDAGSGRIALQAASNGKYVTSASPMYTDGSSIGAAEQFAWLSPVPGQVQLQSVSSGYFVSSEDGTAAMTCNRTEASGWETFDVRAATFDLSGPDLDNTIPILKKALAIDPSIKILATPWTAPTWMKSNFDWVGGSLQASYHGAYAEYFERYLTAMQGQGIPIWAITPQNEPLNPYNEPSMKMTAAEQGSFIKGHLGPVLSNAGHKTRIIAYDHNCDDISYPIAVCEDAEAWVDGSAFHLYAGSISALSTVHDATKKNVYLTEQWTSSTGDFAGDLVWHTENVTIGASSNWARAVLEWNLATDSSFGPHTAGGCKTCQGALTVSGGGYTRNVSYYILAHLAKRVRPGAVRVGSSCDDPELLHVAFENDAAGGGAKVLVVLNKGSSTRTFNISRGGGLVTVSLNAGAVGTYSWH